MHLTVILLLFSDRPSAYGGKLKYNKVWDRPSTNGENWSTVVLDRPRTNGENWSTMKFKIDPEQIEETEVQWSLG